MEFDKLKNIFKKYKYARRARIILKKLLQRDWKDLPCQILRYSEFIWYMRQKLIEYICCKNQDSFENKFVCFLKSKRESVFYQIQDILKFWLFKKYSCGPVIDQ